MQQSIHTVSLFPSPSCSVLRESQVHNVPISYLNRLSSSTRANCQSSLTINGRQLNPSTSCQHLTSPEAPLLLSHPPPHDPESSPLTACNDSPRTDYRKSPESEAGDNDFAFPPDDDPVLPAHSDSFSRDRPPSRPFLSLQPSPYAADPASATKSEDMTDSLISEQLPIQDPPKPHCSAVSQTFPSAPAVPVVHLRPPTAPISPYYRPSHPPPPPPVLVHRDPLHFLQFLTRYRRRLQSQEPCVGPRDLIIPGAQFHHAFDPEELVINLLGKPKLHNVKVSPIETSSTPQADEVDSDEDAEGSVVEDEVMAPVSVTVPSPAKPVLSSPVVKQAPKRRRSPSPEPSHESGAESSDSEEQEVDDEDVYTPTPATASSAAGNRSNRSSRPNKRIRLNVTPSERTTRQSVTSTRASNAGSGRTPHSSRAKNLQSDISREYGCQHGCESRFSTSYEARRHQEDGHGRPEAQMILESITEGQDPEILPRDCRFLIQIGLNGSAKWDDRTKDAVKNSARLEDTPVPGAVATALVNFAKTWVERYICPKCKTSFSRLDSRKRHLEKQCK